MSYALLGDIAFDLLHAPTGFDERRSANFAEHQVLSGKPRLQAMGLALTEITLQLRLHHQLGAVESRYQALITAKEKQEALALVLGFSKFKGNFVITDLSSNVLFTDEKGNPLAREVSLTLREFVGETGAGILGKALAINGNSPLASILPKGLSEFISKARQMISKGVQIYRQARQTITDVKNAIAIIKAMADNPLEALSQLPFVIDSLSGSLGGLAELVGLKDEFEQFAPHIAGVKEFTQGVGELAEQLNTAQSLFISGLNGRSFNGGWFELSEQAIEQAATLSESMAKPAAKMTAWIAIRGDGNA